MAGIVILLNLPLPTALHVKANARGSVSSFQNVMSLVVYRVSEAIRLIRSVDEVTEEKREMAEEIISLRQEIGRLKLLARESRELMKQLDYRQVESHRMVMCQVIARGDISGWWQTLRLDRGSDDGIAPDMAVVTVDGLVGKTTTVSAGTSDVLLITDPNCRVSCRIVRTRAFGVARGSGVVADGSLPLEMICRPTLPRLDFVARDQEVLEGDHVITSGLGGVYPAGLTVGHVKDSAVDKSGLYQSAGILPSAMMDTVRYVFVIVSSEL